jgi:hypothetical protein
MNTNFNYTKYLKYKNKYLIYKEQFGGALGTEPCPKVVSEDTKKMSVSDFLRNTACVYNQIEKHIPEKLAVFDYNDLQEANRGQEYKITIADLKSRNFPPRFFAGKDYPLVELLAGGYLLFKLIEETGFTFRDMKAAGISLKDLYEKGGYGRDDKNIPEILKALKEVGYTLDEFIPIFSLKQIKDAGFNLKEIMDLEKFEISELVSVGFNLGEILSMPDKEYTKEEILSKIRRNDVILKSINSRRRQKINLELIKELGVRFLYQAGYSLKELFDYGFTIEELNSFIRLAPSKPFS